MKITDLLLEDQFETPRVSKNFHGTLKPQWRPRGHELARGTQAAVKADKTDPHMVTKYNHKTYRDDDRMSRNFPSRKDDGYNQFINYLIDNRLMGTNPHFPRVYNVKTINDRDGNRIHTYTIEKLVEPYDVSPSELMAFIENELHPDTVWIEDGDTNRKWVENTMDSVARVLEKCISMESVSRETLKSETLIEAINVLKELDKKFPGQLDLHTGNLMWRRTPYGMVLVFNDPIY